METNIITGAIAERVETEQNMTFTVTEGDVYTYGDFTFAVDQACYKQFVHVSYSMLLKPIPAPSGMNNPEYTITASRIEGGACYIVS